MAQTLGRGMGCARASDVALREEPQAWSPPPLRARMGELATKSPLLSAPSKTWSRGLGAPCCCFRVLRP
eukprot:scaffold19949_cov120-Isochrysis_galbana.AAC.4